jgi:hypothetical protein
MTIASYNASDESKSPSGAWSAVPYSRPVLDPGLASVLLAFGFAGLLALPGLRKTARRAEQRFCETCGRLKILGERTCDCD